MKLIVTRGRRRRRRAGTEMKKGIFFCYKGFKGLKERKKID
jgi:hypothetical protein